MVETLRNTDYYQPLETPEHVLRNLARNEAYRILHETTDPLAREIAEKIIFKTEVKKMVDRLLAYQDDITVYQEFKKLGLFVVRDALSKWTLSHQQSGFDLHEGDSYIDLHVPPIYDRSGLARKISDSLKLTAEYIAIQELHPKYLMGATYGKLARIAPKFGFHTLEMELPADIRQGVENVYREFTERGYEMEPIDGLFICYQTGDEFMQRFLD